MTNCNITEWIRNQNTHKASHALGPAIFISGSATAKTDLRGYLPDSSDSGSSKDISIDKEIATGHTMITLANGWNGDIVKFAGSLQLQVVKPGSGICYLEGEPQVEVEFGEKNDWRILSWRIEKIPNSNPGRIPPNSLLDTITWVRLKQGREVERAISTYTWPEYLARPNT